MNWKLSCRYLLVLLFIVIGNLASSVACSNRGALPLSKVSDYASKGDFANVSEDEVSSPWRLNSLEERRIALLESELAKALQNTDLSRIASSPPVGEQNSVNDLMLILFDGVSATLSWSYRNAGDYNQDGSVNVSDIFPLSEHFFHRAKDGLDEVIDGNENGQVELSDVFVMADNFFASCVGYAVLGAVAGSDEFTQVSFIPFSEASGAQDGRARFTHSFEVQDKVRFKVAPVDNAGNLGAMSQTVVSILPEPPSIQSISPISGLTGSSITFTAIVSGSSPMSFSWDFGGGAIPNTSSDIAPTVTLGQSGAYTGSLTVTNEFGSDTASFDFVVLGESPVISSINVPPGKSGEQVVFSAVVSGEPPLTYSWDFGGGAIPNTSSDIAPRVTLGQSGAYTGSLTVTNEFGSDSENFTYTVDPAGPMTYEVVIRSFAFSPNALTIKVGDIVRWVNLDSVRHTVTSDDGVSFDSPLLGQNETFSFTFNSVGSYSYHCRPHPFMTATIIVTE